MYPSLAAFAIFLFAVVWGLVKARDQCCTDAVERAQRDSALQPLHVQEDHHDHHHGALDRPTIGV